MIMFVVEKKIDGDKKGLRGLGVCSCVQGIESIRPGSVGSGFAWV